VDEARENGETLREVVEDRMEEERETVAQAGRPIGGGGGNDRDGYYKPPGSGSSGPGGSGGNLGWPADPSQRRMVLSSTTFHIFSYFICRKYYFRPLSWESLLWVLFPCKTQWSPQFSRR